MADACHRISFITFRQVWRHLPSTVNSKRRSSSLTIKSQNCNAYDASSMTMRKSLLYLMPRTPRMRRKIYERAMRPVQRFRSLTFRLVRSPIGVYVCMGIRLLFFTTFSFFSSVREIGSNLCGISSGAFKILCVEKLWSQSDLTSLHIIVCIFFLSISSFFSNFWCVFSYYIVLLFVDYKFTTFISNCNRRFRSTSTRPLFVFFLNRACVEKVFRLKR